MRTNFRKLVILLLVLETRANRQECKFQVVRTLGFSCVLSEIKLASKIDINIRPGHNLQPNGNVRAVVIRNSQLSFVPAKELFSHFINLTNLNINEGNRNLKVLNKNDFADAESLTGLFLQNNELGELTAHNFINTPALKYLFLSNNSIHTIEDNAFDGLSDLLELKLDHNKLLTIREKSFVGLSLNHLNLTQNDILTIYYNCFNFNNVKKLSLSGNECIDMNFSDFRKEIHGKIIYRMCGETEISMKNTALTKQLKVLEVEIRRIEITTMNIQFHYKNQILQCENRIEQISKDCEL